MGQPLYGWVKPVAALLLWGYLTQELAAGQYLRPLVETPRQARYHYAKRFGIEASYRLGERTTASTTTQEPAPRFLFVVVSLLLQNVWLYLHWEYVSTPQRGGRELWRWPFEEFIDMVTRAARRVLTVRRAVPANKPPDDRFRR